MTDREALEQLVHNLGLRRAEPDDAYPAAGEFWDHPPDEHGRTRLTIGAGDGNSGFHAEFTFDAEGNIQSHAVVE